MNWRMYLAFFGWCFMKIFGGCFVAAENFRNELKKHTAERIFATAGYVILSIVFMMVIILTSLWLVEDKATVTMITTGCFWLVLFTFFYNVIKAAFECFLEERERVFDELKR